MALSEEDSGLLVFVGIHMTDQVKRIETDPKYRQLSNDAKMAVGGLARAAEIILEIHKRSKA